MATLYQLITRTLGDQMACPEHQMAFDQISKSLHLVCSQCQQEDAFELETLLESPLAAILWFHNSPNQPLEWTKKTIEQDISSRIKRSQVVFNSYLDQIQAAIQSNCVRLRSQYGSLVDKILEASQKSLRNVQKVTEIYTNQLYQQINESELTCWGLQEILSKFLTTNQNPTSEFLLETKSIKETLQWFPYLKMPTLTTHFEDLCDPIAWKLSNFILNANECPPSDVTDSFNLADGKHHVLYGDRGISILAGQQQGPVGVYHAHPVDYCFEINGFRLLGYNQNQILVFSYSDPQLIEVVSKTNARYPSEVEYSHPFVRYKSQNSIWKWDLSSEPSIELQQQQVHLIPGTHSGTSSEQNRYIVDTGGFVTLG